MIFESRKEYKELVDEVEEALDLDETEEDKEDDVWGQIPLAKVKVPSDGRRSGNRQNSDFVMENVEDRIIRIIKEREAVGEIKPVGALGRNNPRTEGDVTPSKARRAKSDEYGSTRKGDGNPESQNDGADPDDPIEKLAAEMDDETGSDQ